MEPLSRHGWVPTAGLLLMLVSFMGLTQPTRADVLVLANGDRIEGQIVGETTRDISIRRRFKNSNILYVENVSKGTIARIEKGSAESQPEVAGSAPADAGATSRPSALAHDPLAREAMIEGWKAGGSLSPEKDAANRPIYLRRAIDRWKEGQTLAAAGELTRLLTSSKAAELDVLSPECETRVGMKLPEFAARVHWTVAKNRAKSGPLRLTGVAPYEVPAIIPLLINEYDATLRREIEVHEPVSPKTGRGQAKASSRPAAGEPAGGAPKLPAYVVPQSQPTSDPALELANRLTISNWIDRPNELVLSRAEAGALGVTIVYAISLLNERLRLDPAARRDRSLHTTLSGQRIQLLGLLRAVGQRAGERERAQKRAQVGEEEALLQDLQKQLQRDENTLLQKALQMAQEQQLEQNAAINPPPANPKAGANRPAAPPPQAVPPEQGAPANPK